MTVFNIRISDERLAQLKQLAKQAGLAAEEYLERRINQLLEAPDDQFAKAAEYVLKKNMDLYHRLS